MKNQYYNEMVEMLLKRPDGMRLGAIARTIYNSSCDLFDLEGSRRFAKIYSSVGRYLWTQSRRKKSPFERRSWGTYALRPRFVYQLELTFDEWDDELPPRQQAEYKPKRPEPIMLSLFPDF